MIPSLILALILAGMLSAFGGSASADGIDDNNICYVKLRGGDHKAAVDYCSRAIESGELVSADMVAALINRGVAYRANGESAKAVTDYTRALMYDPKDAMIYANRANALRDLGEFARAIDDADKAIALDPKRGDSFYTRGEAHEALGDRQKARRDYLQALALDPDNAAYKEKLLAMDGAVPEIKR